VYLVQFLLYKSCTEQIVILHTTLSLLYLLLDHKEYKVDLSYQINRSAYCKSEPGWGTDITYR